MAAPERKSNLRRVEGPKVNRFQHCVVMLCELVLISITVMNQPKVEQFSTEQSNTEEEIVADKVETRTNLRTKSKICKPHYLKDFVTNANPK